MVNRVIRSSSLLLTILVLALLAKGRQGFAADVPPIPLTRSWISIGPNTKAAGQDPAAPWIEGDEWVVPIEYYVHPEDMPEGAGKLHLAVVGPWIDNPDGKYTTKRHHIEYPGLGGEADVKVGSKEKAEFRMKIPAPAKAKGEGKVGDGLILIASFKDKNGKDWPWTVRGSGPWFSRKGGKFELVGSAPGNLFTYAEPVDIRAVFQPAIKEDFRKGMGTYPYINWTVTDVAGHEVAKRTVSLADLKDLSLPLGLDIKERGTFVLEASYFDMVGATEVAETRRVTFARIPDVLAITRNGKTPFGMTGVVRAGATPRHDAMMKIARRLGLTVCRSWMRWEEIEPAPGEWRGLEDWDQGLELAKKNGIEPWILLEGPPPWAVAGPAKDFSYTAFPFRDAQLHDTVTYLGTRFKGKILGWEWLNEIVPGDKLADPVAEYARFCQVATQAAKAADPAVITTLAGGLWPRSFRQSLLAAGVGKWIDVLPVHYSDGNAIRMARADVDAAGQSRIAIWDNETAQGLSTWNMPLPEALQIRNQSDWVMSHWSDEMLAGAQKIIYFGGDAEPAGNWSYLWDDLTPRPLAATLAVFTSKMWDAQPVGAFRLGQGAEFRVFQKPDGSALVVAGCSGAAERVALDCGGKALVLTDHQGNETNVAAGEAIPVPGAGARVFIEGADLNALKARLVAQIQTGSAEDDGLAVPQVQTLAGTAGELRVRLKAIYKDGISKDGLTCGLFAAWPEGWPQTLDNNLIQVHEGTDLIVTVPIPPPPQNAPPITKARLFLAFLNLKAPTVEIPFDLHITNPDMLGNLIKNGGFELEGKNRAKIADWDGGSGLRTLFTEPDLGHETAVWRVEHPEGYATIAQSKTITTGGKYLYTAWLKTSDLSIGSNVDMVMTDGKHKTLFDLQVFSSAQTVADWEVITGVIEVPQNVAAISLIPLGKGTGWAMVDNIRFSAHEGTDFAAEAHKIKKPVVIDGNLDDWPKGDPIPLIGRNQLKLLREDYKWSPANFSGVAYLQWDEKNLYLAVEVRDDQHVAATTGEETLKGDSLLLALHPGNRVAGQDHQAFAYYLSSANPGGGSGQYTLYRPPEKSGGLNSGSLAKDSSVYELVVKHTEGKTIYEARLPLAELGNIRASLGTRIGCSLQLQDNDGSGPAATLTWGGGLSPTWQPTQFGLVILTE